MGYLFNRLRRSTARMRRLRELKAPQCLLDNEQRIQHRLMDKILVATVEYEKKNSIKPLDRSGM